jgi:NAD(P)-dependent dehydrogenase (short-subunit alcohol dehydrogenase family)
MDLTDRLVVVTGGGSGLGAATAAILADAGAKVVLFDRDEAAASAHAARIGGRAQVLDVTDAAAVEAAFGALDTPPAVLVNCAGIAPAERLLGRNGPHGLESFRRAVDINLSGSFNTMRIAAAAMARAEPDADGCRGVIVNTASIAGYEGQKGQTAYAASKGGIIGLTLPAARDLATLGIRVNAIAPGVFLTPMLEGLGADVGTALAADVTFPRRLGKPEEFGALVRHIVENPYLNGAVIRLDGALRMR